MTCHPSESLSLFPYHARLLINVFRQSFSMVCPRGQRPNITVSFLAHRAHLWARGEAFYVETPARLGCVWNTPADLVSTKRVSPMWRRADRSLRRAPMKRLRLPIPRK